MDAARDVADIKRTGFDSTETEITDVYYRNPPRYAVYQTADRVRVHLADEGVMSDDGVPLGDVQRAALAQINPVRGQIDGLIDNWRRAPVDVEKSDVLFARSFRVHRATEVQKSAAHFDRRVADALALALERDLANAKLYLDGVKRDIDDLRASRARRLYIAAAAAMAGGLLLFVTLLLVIPLAIRMDAAVLRDVHGILVAAGAGTFGALFSVAIFIRNRAELSDLRPWDNSVDAILRIGIGFVAGMVLLCLVRSGVVSSIAFGDDAGRLDPGKADSWRMVAVIGFVAGFSERLVGDLLARAVISRDSADAPATPLPPGTPDKGGAGAAAAGSVAGAAVAQDADGCDAPFDPALETDDADLPEASGGVAPADDPP